MAELPIVAQRPPRQRAAIERPAEIHLHFHGVSAEDIAAILRHRDQLR